MKRQHVDAILASMAGRPGAANSFLKRLKTLMVFAVANEWITSDPTYRMRPYKAGEVHTWDEEEIAQFEAQRPVGTRERLACALHLYTGQRRSDVHRMTWADLRGDRIRVVQTKTGARLDVPVHPALAEILAVERREHLIITADHSRWPATASGSTASSVPLVCRRAARPMACARRPRDASPRRAARLSKSARSLATGRWRKSSDTPALPTNCACPAQR